VHGPSGARWGGGQVTFTGTVAPGLMCSKRKKKGRGLSGIGLRAGRTGVLGVVSAIPGTRILWGRGGGTEGLVSFYVYAEDGGRGFSPGVKPLFRSLRCPEEGRKKGTTALLILVLCSSPWDWLRRGVRVEKERGSRGKLPPPDMKTPRPEQRGYPVGPLGGGRIARCYPVVVFLLPCLLAQKCKSLSWDSILATRATARRREKEITTGTVCCRMRVSGQIVKRISTISSLAGRGKKKKDADDLLVPVLGT